MKKLVVLFMCPLILFAPMSYASPDEIDELLCIDSSNIEHGVITVAILDPVDSLRYKLRVTHGEKEYLYNLDSHGETVVSLQMGNGAYAIALFEQIAGNAYRPVGEIKLHLNIDRKYVWLESNSKVNYASSNQIRATLSKVVSDSDTEAQKYKKITQYIERDFIYDWLSVREKASPEYTDLDRVLSRKMGLCEELSALTVAMLRLSNIRSRLVIGRANSSAHAWVESVVDDKVKRFDPISYLFWRQTIKYFPERYY